MTIEQVITQVSSLGLSSVCLTGGEPLVQLKESIELMKGLKEGGYTVHLETNGSIFDKLAFSLADCVCLDMKPPSSSESSDESIL